MFHRVNGHGEPLVLLNGIAMSVASWEEMARPLAALCLDFLEGLNS